jgi:hypothetical protein
MFILEFLIRVQNTKPIITKMPLIPYSREDGLYAHKKAYIPANRPPNNAGTMQDGLGCVKRVGKVACTVHTPSEDFFIR